MMSRNPKSVSSNFDEDGNELRRGPWTLEEDSLLIQHITSHGEGQWNSLAKSAGLKRTGKSCRLRWLNYLKPDTKRGNLTPHEQLLILELHSRWGNRWSKIAQHLPGRTDNEIKNYWRTRVQKQARQLKVDSNSKKFLEAVRLYWMPRLREKMEQSTATSSPASSVSETPNLVTTEAAPSPPQTDGAVSPPPPPKSNGGEVDHSDGVKNFQEISGFLTSFDRDGCCNVDGCYGMQELGCGEISMSACHVADVDWFREDIESSFWNSYELWH